MATPRALPPVVTTATVGLLTLSPAWSWLRSGPYDEQRHLQVALLAVVWAATLLVPTRRRAVVGLLAAAPRAGLLTAAALVAGMASAVLAVDPLLGLREVGLAVLLGGHALAVATETVAAPGRTLRVLGRGATLALLTYAAGLGAGVLAEGATTDLVWQRAGIGGFANPRFLDQWAVLLLGPAVAGAAAPDEPPGWRAASALAALAGTAMVLSGGGRGPLLAVVAAAVVVLGVRRGAPTGRLRRRVATGLAAAAALGLGAVTIAVARAAAGRGGLLADQGRLALWADTTGTIADAPLLGIGPGHLAHVTATAGADVAAHPHQLLLQLAAEWGTPVALVAAVGLAVLLRRVVALARSGDTAVRALGPLAAVVAVATLAMVSGIGVAPLSQLATTAVVGVALGLHRHDRARAGSGPDGSDTAPAERDLPPPTVGTAARRAALVGLVLTVPLCAVTVTATATTTADDHGEALLSWFEEHQGARLRPRFWQIGEEG